MEKRNLFIDNNGAQGPSAVKWSIDGIKDEWEVSVYRDKIIGDYNSGFPQERNLDQNSKILVDIEAGTSGVSSANISAPSVSSTLKIRTECSGAPAGISLDIQNFRGCCASSILSCQCGWCVKKPEESNGTRRFNEAINPEVQYNPNVRRSFWIGKFASIQGRSFIAFAIIFFVTIIAITTISLRFTLHSSSDPEIQSTRTYCARNKTENLDWYVSRESWEASDPKYNLEMSSHERTYIVVGHTVTSYCMDLERCSQQMRTLQANAINTGFADIPYHFVIGGDGRAYEGRTWQVAPEKTYNCDSDCLFVSFTGDYRNCCSAPNHVPSEEQMQAFDYLLDTSWRLNRLKEDFAILPQCKVASSQSPGSNLYNAIEGCNQFDLNAGTFTGFCNLNCAGEC